MMIWVLLGFVNTPFGIVAVWFGFWWGVVVPLCLLVGAGAGVLAGILRLFTGEWSNRLLDLACGAPINAFYAALSPVLLPLAWLGRY